jgi:hypothetical protein
VVPLVFLIGMVHTPPLFKRLILLTGSRNVAMMRSAAPRQGLVKQDPCRTLAAALDVSGNAAKRETQATDPWQPTRGNRPAATDIARAADWAGNSRSWLQTKGTLP